VPNPNPSGRRTVGVPNKMSSARVERAIFRRPPVIQPNSGYRDYSRLALGDAALLFRQRLISAVGAPIGPPRQISNNIADLRWTFGAKKFVCRGEG
jgi:hypothetical protein